MAFLNPIFLIGALAAAIPVLVHLVRRTQGARMEFASLMFLRRIEQKTIRKRRLRNLLLLAMRCAALLLLALAFARPYFTLSSPMAAGGDRAASVILLDGSFSMSYPGVFDRARQAAREIINQAAPEDQIALVLFGQGYDVLMPLKDNRNEALALLESAQPGLGATDYLQAIASADAMLKDAVAGERRIHLISDFQVSGWDRSAPPVKLSVGVELVPKDVSDAEPANVAVTEVKAEPIVYTQKYSDKVSTRLNNFGAEAVDTAVDFKINDLVVERRQVVLEANSSQVVEFSGFNVQEGSSRATVELNPDRFQLDNKFFFTIKREDQARVLAIETATRGRSETFFLQQALGAGENAQHELTVKTAGAINPAEIDSYRAIIVNDAAGISDALGGAIKNFVERGGGLILAAGKHTDPTDFNRLFGAVSPAQIGETVQGRGYALLSQIKADHPIFGVFARGGRLTSTRVYAYRRAQATEKASTIAALDDGTPVVVEGLAGRGKVLLVTTTLDTAWNDLPLTPMFLPLVRQMLEYLDGREHRSSYTIGQVVGAPPDKDGSLPAIDNPGGGRIDDARTSPSGGLSVPAAETGFYRLRYRDRAEYLAVNLDAKESDLIKLNVDEFMAGLLADPNTQNQRQARPGGAEPVDIEARQRLWLPLIILALTLFVAEALIARRIRLARLAG
jgi:phage FluMu protein gp41